MRNFLATGLRFGTNITASSPTATAPTMSPRHGSCSRCPRRSPSRKRKAPRATTRAVTRAHAPAAGAARHRGLRTRLRTEAPADACRDRDRHVMTRLSHRAAADPIGRLAAGNDPTRRMLQVASSGRLQWRAHNASHNTLTDALAGSAPCRWPRALPFALEQGSNPHRASLTDGASLPAISCLGASRTPSGRASRTLTSRRPRNLHLGCQSSTAFLSGKRPRQTAPQTSHGPRAEHGP